MDEKTLERLVKRWTFGPHAFYYFVTEALSVTPYSQQKEFIYALNSIIQAKLKKRILKQTLTSEEEVLNNKLGVCVRAGRGPGKEAVTSWAQIWFQSMFEPHEVLATGPNAEHLKTVYWKEVYKWMFRKDKKTNQNFYFFAKDFAWTATKIYKKNSIKGEAEGAINFASYKTVQKNASGEEQREGVSGHHQDFIMFIIDEASGVPDAVYEALKGSLTREEEVGFMVVLFNPNRNTGFAHDIHTTTEGRRWYNLHWNSEDCEGIDPEVIEDARRYGEDSNYYRINIRGEFPLADEEKVIPWQFIESAIEREVQYEQYDIIACIDPAGEGKDKTIISFKQGPKWLDFFYINESYTDKIASKCIDKIEQYDPTRIYVDKIGVGLGVFSELRTVYRGRRKVYGVNTKESPTNKKLYRTMRDELWFRLRREFEDGRASIPNVDRVKVELNAPEYETNGQGQLVVTPKPKMRKLLGGGSPDYADTMCLSVYHDYMKYDSAAKAATDKYRQLFNKNKSQFDSEASWLGA